jgi:2-polyprenyl-3-methyl-5-hydroxy-6-metoxy-1,4-benzoquinol methylase
MKKLPKPEVYEKQFRFFPWGKLIREVLEYITKNISKNSIVLDLMCGPGYLLGQLASKRSDLHLTGVDINEGFIAYSKRMYPGISFIKSDAIEWKSSGKYDLVLCTAGLHHIPYDKQEMFIRKISALIEEKGTGIIADPYVDSYSNEDERRRAASRLGYEYLKATLKNKPPEDIIKSAIDIMHNDVLGYEYKTSLQRTVPIFKRNFKEISVLKTWPLKDSEYGEYCIIAKK